jgi:hypothetical protein
MTQEYYDRYKAQSQELYTFLSRSFHGCGAVLRACVR